MSSIITAIIVASLTLIAQKTLTNFLGGIFIYASKPFKMGDKVTIQRYGKDVASGHVMKVGLIFTSIKAYNRDVYILSNATLSECCIINSDFKERVNHTECIKITPDSNIKKTIEIINRVISCHPKALNNDDNTNIVCRYEDNALCIKYNVRTEDLDTSYKACSDICRHIFEYIAEEDDIKVV